MEGGSQRVPLSFSWQPFLATSACRVRYALLANTASGFAYEVKKNALYRNHFHPSVCNLASASKLCVGLFFFQVQRPARVSFVKIVSVADIVLFRACTTFFPYFVRLGWHFHGFYCVNVSSVKTGIFKAIVYLRASVNFLIFFHLLHDF